MATMRTNGVITQPPSPIPRAAGSRSAANETFSEYLQSSLRPPNLSLPPTTLHPISAELDLQSLASRLPDSVHRLLWSARQYGAFRISGHGISGEELRSLMEEAETVFRNAKAPSFVERSGSQMEIVWARSPTERLEAARRLTGVEHERYKRFSEITENVARKLDAVAKQLIQIFMENADKKCDGIQGKRTILRLRRYDHNTLLMEQNQPFPGEKEDRDHALSLHLPTEHSQFCVQSNGGLWYFEDGPDTIVATVGRQLEEWSLGEFKGVSGHLMIEPHDQRFRAAYSVELKYSPSITHHASGKNYKTISILDQILFAVIATLLYKVYVFALL